MSHIAGRARHAERGMTLVELMVSLIVVSIVVAFTFRIYSQSSSAYRSQARVSELQQTLRTAKDQILKDMRMAGFLTTSLHDASGGDPAFVMAPITVVNNADGTGPDELTIVYADSSCYSRIQSTGPPFNAAVSTVDSWSCFADGDLAVAVRTALPNIGGGCVLKITGLVAGGPKLQHNPGGSGAPYNQPGNTQCDQICGGVAPAVNNSCWNDGHTVFMKYKKRTYRIKPNSLGDYRGTLQMAENGGAFQDLAFGFTDLQVALYIYDPAGAVDTDGDGDPKKNWMSGNNMNSTTLLAGNKELMQARISLVARTTWEVDGVMTAATPNLQGTGSASANSIGDHPSIALINASGQPTILTKTNRLYGNHIFRSVSALVDFRNMGIGK